jgi:HSP20 family protein
LPGVAASDLDVTIADGRLNIKAERRQVHEENSAFSHRIERKFGRIQRSIPIPAAANMDSSSAKFENGVLTVVFNKHTDTLAPKKLQIT